MIFSDLPMLAMQNQTLSNFASGFGHLVVAKQIY
jgi:hypothetical protein